MYGRYPVPSHEIEYVFLLMRRVFKNDFDDEHCKSIRGALEGNIDGCIETSKKYFPSNKADLIAEHILNNNLLIVSAGLQFSFNISKQMPPDELILQ